MSSNSPDTKQIKQPIVRTLKPPPEIWELVHTVEVSQSTPLLTRLRSSGANFILLALVGGLLIGGGAAFWQFRSTQETAAIETTQPVQASPTSSSNDTTNPAVSTAAPTDTSVTQPEDVNVSDSSSRASARSSKRKASIATQVRPDIASSETSKPRSAPPRSQAPKTDQQSRTAEASKNVAESASAKPRSNTSMNSLVVAPAKAASTPKAKVIQWP